MADSDDEPLPPGAEQEPPPPGAAPSTSVVAAAAAAAAAADPAAAVYPAGYDAATYAAWQQYYAGYGQYYNAQSYGYGYDQTAGTSRDHCDGVQHDVLRIIFIAVAALSDCIADCRFAPPSHQHVG